MCDYEISARSPRPANQSRRRPMPGRRQAKEGRLALRAKVTRGVLIETCNHRWQKTCSSGKRARGVGALVEQPSQNPFRPTTTPLAVPETDPQRTKALWECVLKPRMPPRGGRGALKPVSEAGTERTTVSGVSETGSVGSTTESRTTTKAPILWRQLVFQPRGIDLVSSDWDLALDHFEKFDADALHCPEWIMLRLESEEQSVLLRGGSEFNKRTAAEYTEMERRHLCEEEFATYAKENLFRRPPFLPIENAPREWSAERMIQLNAAPSAAADSLWLPPPLLSGDKSEGKDFVLRPDCAYWQSLLAFSDSYRDLVELETFTVDNRITCPYLTIEFKRSGLAVEQAINQVIAASALALYNRYRLKARRLATSKKPWTEKHFQQIRHYAMTFTGCTADIWLVRLKAPTDLDFSAVSWTGCEVMRIGHCVCSSSQAIGDLVEWVNTIHWWGITKHGRYCADDIKAGLLSRKGRVAKRCSELFEQDEPVD